jgi:5-methylcytosine-specific restriction protein A
MARLCLYYGSNCSDEGRCPPGKSRCKAHGGGSWARVSAISKGRYGASWQQLRARVLRESPNCEECGQPATDVDHIVAIADGGTDARSNLRALCNTCHKRYTAAQNRARRKRRSSQQGAAARKRQRES